MLVAGGNAVDAAVAAQMVLGVVEPQSSGLGGGALIMWWDASKKRLVAIDGLSRAPSMLPKGSLPRFGGSTAGVPGALRALADIHARAGRLPWAQLFESAIDAAEHGFPMPAYLHRALSGPDAAKLYPTIFPNYTGSDGKLVPVGTMVRNPALAATLRRIATLGAETFYRGQAAERLATAIEKDPQAPGTMTASDLESYRAVERGPICSPFMVYIVCTTPPPSFGGIAMLQMLNIIEMRAEGRFDFTDPRFVHIFADAGRLAEANREVYVGDPDLVSVPTEGLLDRHYHAQRAALIPPDTRLSPVGPGNPPNASADLIGGGNPLQPGTSQISIVDAFGNALSMTTTINVNFGSRVMVDGYILNNAMTNFFDTEPLGRSANQSAPDKRPVTSMAPTIVFDSNHKPLLVGGSAGSGQIVDYIAQTLVDILGNGATPEMALALGHVSTITPDHVDAIALETGTSISALETPLTRMGYAIEISVMPSGLGFLQRVSSGWIGAADPRRDGVSLGE